LGEANEQQKIQMQQMESDIALKEQDLIKGREEAEARFE